MSTVEKRKQLIEDLLRFYEDSWNHEYVYGNPDELHLEKILESIVGCLELAAEWKDEAKKNSWNIVLSSVEELAKTCMNSIEQAKKGCDPLSQGMWIVELLNRIPMDIVKQKLGITSMKELSKRSLTKNDDRVMMLS